ncbi:hypothetical protein [Streptomyces mirabilis]|uniref:hypothetical protein n=1 Tax=Streptomyces mirabilis TaxID=68239 RepID=UPI0036BC6939
MAVASLLAQEFSHMMVARCHGVAGDEITLWLLGGAARRPIGGPRIAGNGRRWVLR